MKKTRVLDLFCGIGGSSVGAESTGLVEIVAGVDCWDIAIETYSFNFPNTHPILGNLFEIDPHNLKGAIGDIDLIMASPECTSHSVARGALAKDEQSLDTALLVPKFVKEFLPKWVIIENVIQMRTWHKYCQLYHELEILGYHVAEVVLNAVDFGVPQTRKRLFIIAVKGGIPQLPIRRGKVIPTAETVIQPKYNVFFGPVERLNRSSTTIANINRCITYIGRGKPFIYAFYNNNEQTRPKGRKLARPLSQPLWTIISSPRLAIVRPGDNGYELRMLDPEELKLGMGFTSDFELLRMAKNTACRLIGNSVCPPVMRAIVEANINGNGKRVASQLRLLDR